MRKLVIQRYYPLFLLALLLLTLGLVQCRPETAVSYELTVVDELTGLALPRAQAILTAPEQPDITAVANEDGVIILEIPFTYDQLTGFLAVEAPGFVVEIIELPLLPDSESQTVELLPGFE